MFSYTLKRLGQTVLVLIGITLITFLLLNVVPGDPVAMMLDKSFAGTSMPLISAAAVIAIAIINNPQGVYYGGQVAAPIIRQLYENILPYLGLEKTEDTVVENH